MTNPAYELHELFARWMAASRNEVNAALSAAKARQLEAPFDGTGAAEHRKAVALLVMIRKYLQAMESQGRDTAMYSEYLPEWEAAVFVFPDGWSKDGAAPFNRPMMLALRGLAWTLNDHYPRPTSESFASVRSQLESIVSAAKDDESLPDDLKLFINRVVRKLQTCLDEFDTHGRFDYYDASEQLKVALYAAEGKSKKSDFWRAAGDKWAQPFVVNTAAAVAGAALLAIRA